MKTILSLKSSTNGVNSHTNKLVDAIVQKLCDKYQGSSVKDCDLTLSEIPHLNGYTIGAFYTPAEHRNEALNTSLAASNKAIDDLMEADFIVIGVPMYNFGIPSVLKAWIDQITRVGVTFYFDETGMPNGLVHDKKVFLAISSGGIYSEGPMKQYDFTEPYLRSIFAYLGITDITTVRAEGTAIPGLKELSLNKGLEAVSALYI